MEDLHHLDTMITNLSTLRGIKSDYVHRNRISTDIIIDSMSAKNLLDKLCFSRDIFVKDKDSLKGYIQNISIDPFGLLFTSEIQVLLAI